MAETSEHKAATILVVDDDPRIRTLVSKILDREGYAVLEAADGNEADAQMREGRPDLVILDQVLPHVTGPELLRRWRANGYEAGVVILTGHGDEDTEVEVLESGADDYVTKPFRPRELVAHVAAVLRRT